MGTANRKQKSARAKGRSGARARRGATASRTAKPNKRPSSGKSAKAKGAAAVRDRGKVGAAKRLSKSVAAKPAATAPRTDSRLDVRGEPKVELKVDAKADAASKLPVRNGASKVVAGASAGGVVAAVVRPEAEVSSAERVPPPLPVPIASFTF